MADLGNQDGTYPEKTSAMPLTGLHLDNFFSHLRAANRPRLDDFQHWLCHPGMLFQSRRQWWGQEKPRHTPHEGLDLRWYQDTFGQRRCLDHTTVIPAPFPGKIVHIISDFLGHSLFLPHSVGAADGRRLLFALGHVAPRHSLTLGQTVSAGDILAELATPAKGSVPPHLHLTLALIPDSLPPALLTWDYLGTSPDITLLNPLAVFPTAVAMLWEAGVFR